MAESAPSTPITGSQSATARQPTEFNYSQTNQFRVYSKSREKDVTNEV